MSVTREQAAILATLLRTIRPAWDELAIIQSIGQVRDRDLAHVAAAAIRTATNADARTPKAIAFTDSDAWQHDRPAETYRSPRTSEQCRRPGHSGWATNCAQCASERKGVPQ